MNPDLEVNPDTSSLSCRPGLVNGAVLLDGAPALKGYCRQPEARLNGLS